ncbi:MAG: FHA domain-containing protein [Deltaproteobacteria bacterium]|nr:MAG: FHA domain-containing protein [Deltaproteobacteria bacterium]
MANESQVLTFEVYRGDSLIKTAEFSQPSITIGKGEAAALRVDGDGVADLHAVLNVSGDSLNIADLGADGGTRLNGEPVTNGSVTSGDSIQIGELRIVVAVHVPEAFDEEEATMVAMDPAELAREMEAASFDDDALDEDDEPEPLGAGGVIADVPSEDEETDADPDGINEVEDVMAWIMRSGTATSGLGIDKTRPKVLEVNQIWEDLLLDTKHFLPEGKPVSIGASTGWKWNFLGVNMGWVPTGVHQVLKFTPPMWSEVVSEWKNDFYAPDDKLGGTEHNLFKWDGERYVAEVSSNWDGFVDIGESRHSFDELVSAGHAKKSGNGYEIPMSDDTRLVVDVDGVVFFAHNVHRGKRIIARLTEDVDYPFLAIFSVIAFIGLVFGVFLYTGESRPQNEMVEIPDRFVELLIQKPEPVEEKKKPSGNPDAGEGAKAKREEGKVGKKEAKMEKAKGNKVEIQKRELDKQIAENAGLLGALSDNGAMDGVFGSSALDSSLTGGIGGLIGAKGTQIGSGGLGSRGGGLGGGGTAEGLGGLGTKGMGSGASGYGSGGGNFGAKGEGGIGRVGGDPIILGALDRSLIDEVIKRHMNAIRYCYQRELTKSPSLGGKIVIKFVIAKDGSVSSANVKTTTMNNSAVESCVSGRFMRMQFPQPKGGGIVIVSYPFLFAPG